LNPGHIAKPVAKGEFKDHYTRRLDPELEGYFQRPVLGVTRNEAPGRRATGLIPSASSTTWQRLLTDIFADHTIVYKNQFELTSAESMGASLMEFFGDMGTETGNFSQYAYDCPGYAAEIPDGPITQTCDPATMFKPAPGTLKFSCEKSPGFKTYSYTYCPWLSIDVPSNPALAAYSCFANPTSAGFEDDTEESNALCATREICESLCLAFDDCIGIDLVIGKPRCFLNRADTSHGPDGMCSTRMCSTAVCSGEGEGRSARYC